MTCAQRYAYRYKLRGAPGVSEGDRLPLIRGTLGHIGLAHYYARLGCIQHGKDPELYYGALEAIDEKVRRMAELKDSGLEIAQEVCSLVKRAVLAYTQHYAADQLEVIGVELPVEMQFAGHRMTQRFDLVVRDRSGRIWVWDHKFVSKIDSRSVGRYTLSGQFLEMVWQGKQRYGEAFAGVRINMIGVGGDPTFFRASPEPAPFALQQFPQTVAEAERRILELEGRDPWHYPRPFSETICMTAYGPCDYFDLCRWGPT